MISCAYVLLYPHVVSSSQRDDPIASQPLSTLSRDWTFSSLPWPRRAEPREQMRKKQRRGCGNGCACAGTCSDPKSLRVAHVSGTTKTGKSPFVSRSSWDVDGVAATCRNKARACEISILSALRDVVIAVVASFRSGDTGGNHKAGQGWMGEARRAREKKSVGRGSDRRCVSSFCRQRAGGSPFVADAICVSLWTGLFGPPMALQMLGEKRPAFLGCPASLRLECSACIAGL
jgi:hypothetical protein